MYAKITILAALLAVAPMAQAGESVADASDAQADASVSIAELARESGLSQANVRMLLGARTPYAEYRCCYNQILSRFKQAVGEDTYRRLTADRSAWPAESRIAARVDEDKDAVARIEVSAL